MSAWNGELAEEDVARVLAAAQGVHEQLAGLFVPAYWPEVFEAAERGGDPSARWYANKLAAANDGGVGFSTGNGLSDEVGRRFVDPIIATTLARTLPPVDFQTAVSNCSSILRVTGDEAWRAYAAEVQQVMNAAESSPDEAERLLSMGAANLQARDADASEFMTAVTANGGASESEAEWLLVVAAARQQGWDPIKLQGQAFLRRFNTAGIAAPGTAVKPSGAETTATAQGAAPRSRDTTPPSIGG